MFRQSTADLENEIEMLESENARLTKENQAFMLENANLLKLLNEISRLAELGVR